MSKFLGFLTLLILSLVCCVGCNSNVARKDILGIYQVHYPYGLEGLELMDDGHYRQTFLMHGDTNPKINFGKWDLSKDASKNCTQIVFQNAMVVDDGFGKPREEYWKINPGLSIFCVTTFFGKTAIHINEDQDFAYIRK